MAKNRAVKPRRAQYLTGIPSSCIALCLDEHQHQRARAAHCWKCWPCIGGGGNSWPCWRQEKATPAGEKMGASPSCTRAAYEGGRRGGLHEGERQDGRTRARRGGVAAGRGRVKSKPLSLRCWRKGQGRGQSPAEKRNRPRIWKKEKRQRQKAHHAGEKMGSKKGQLWA